MGYVCGFALFAFVQSLVILLFVVFALKVHYSGNLALVFLISVLLTVGSVNLGIFLSTFAHNEFQVVQFIPLVFGVQVFLSGVFWPVAQLPKLLQPVAYILPLTYANDALRSVMLKNAGLTDIGWQLLALLAFALLMILLSSLVTRRQIA
jgi:ABC-2 type transport system permease protein